VTGHLLGGAGGLEAGISVLALCDQILPRRSIKKGARRSATWTTFPNAARKASVCTMLYRIRLGLGYKQLRSFQLVDWKIADSATFNGSFEIVRPRENAMAVLGKRGVNAEFLTKLSPVKQRQGQIIRTPRPACVHW